jgi:hypothetical protein
MTMFEKVFIEIFFIFIGSTLAYYIYLFFILNRDKDSFMPSWDSRKRTFVFRRSDKLANWRSTLKADLDLRFQIKLVRFIKKEKYIFLQIH